jgi:hypothetical protein
MAEQQRVLVYGDSVLLAGVQASLSAFPDLEIVSLEELPADWVAILHELHPSVILFDLGGASPDLPLAILRQPNLRVIGIGPDNGGTLVLSSHPAQTLSAQELLNVMRDGTQPCAEGK